MNFFDFVSKTTQSISKARQKSALEWQKKVQQLQKQQQQQAVNNHVNYYHQPITSFVAQASTNVAPALDIYAPSQAQSIVDWNTPYIVTPNGTVEYHFVLNAMRKSSQPDWIRKNILQQEINTLCITNGITPLTVVKYQTVGFRVELSVSI